MTQPTGAWRIQLGSAAYYFSFALIAFAVISVFWLLVSMFGSSFDTFNKHHQAPIVLSIAIAWLTSGANILLSVLGEGRKKGTAISLSSIACLACFVLLMILGGFE